MSNFPFEAILIYLTILFAPLDADRVVLDFPSESQRAEVLRNGQTWQFDGYVFEINGDSLVIFGAEGRETYKISEFVALPNDESRATNRTFALGAGIIMHKTATGLEIDNESAETVQIHYQFPDNPNGEASVNVLGNVGNAGVFQLPANPTVRDAITAAGGPASGADMTRVSIIRGAAGTMPYVTSIDLTVDDAFDPQLRSGDTIHLPGRGESASGGQ